MVCPNVPSMASTNKLTKFSPFHLLVCSLFVNPKRTSYQPLQDNSILPSSLTAEAQLYLGNAGA